MAVDNAILKIITKECCCSLWFDDEQRQFIFPFRIGLPDIWITIRRRIHRIDPCFNLNDFNNELRRMSSISELSIELPVSEICDADLLPGESLRIKLSQGYTPVSTLVKMKSGQYLDISTGQGFSLGDCASFNAGAAMVTSEGERLGICNSISLLMPTTEHLVMSRVMLGAYYRKRISDSLWPLHNLAKSVNYDNATNVCRELLSMASKMGVGIKSFLDIINASVKYGI